MSDQAQRTVLVVEDEEALAVGLRDALLHGGFEATVVGDGVQGLEAVRAQQPDLLVLDLMLPGMSGLDVLKALRAEGFRTRVLIVTALADEEDLLRGFQAGADDYLTKPFELSELLARLRALVRRAAGRSTAILEIGDVVLDTVKRTVTRGDESIDLTAQEYKLVELLALRRGGVVTRAVIHDHLFGEADETRSNLVEVHVCNIRKKIRPDFITTRRGHGYLIDG